MGETSEQLEEWFLTFHGCSYIVELVCTDQFLSLTVEDESTCARWSGEFTSNYIEEITQKAGNFKRFSLFLEMIRSALSQSSSALSMDLLTTTDLEMMKARRSGMRASTESISTTRGTGEQGQKRYAILTYTGEFDRVHYPLPLVYEEQPNFASLRRTIRRLREQLRNRGDESEAGVDETGLRTILAQTKRENTELRHRLRLATSRSSRTSDSYAASTVSANAELSTENQKLRSKNESLKKELSALSAELDRVKINSAKELARWKQKLGVRHDENTSTSSSRAQESVLVSELRRKLAAAERELKLERLARGVPSARRGSSASPAREWNSSTTPSRNITPSRNTTPRRPSTRSVSNELPERKNIRSASPQLARHTSPGYTAGRPSRPSRPSPDTSRRYTSPRESPRRRNSRDDISVHSSGSAKRFDPTAYQRNREVTLQQKAQQRQAAWGSGRGSSTPRSTRSQSPYAGAGDGYSSSHSVQSVSSVDSSKQKKYRKKKPTGSTPSPKAVPSYMAPRSGKIDLYSDYSYSSTGVNSTSHEPRRNEMPSRLLTPRTHPSPSAGAVPRQSNLKRGLTSEERERVSRTASAMMPVVDRKPSRPVVPNPLPSPQMSDDDYDEPIFSQKRELPIENESISLPQREVPPPKYDIHEPRTTTSAATFNAESTTRNSVDTITRSSVQSINSDYGVTPDRDIAQIDKRIQALQEFLDSARMGMAASKEDPLH